MKATYEFDMGEPRERKQAILLLKAEDLAITLWDISQLFRNSLKYEGLMRDNKYLTEDEYAVVEKLQERFNEILKDNDINMDTLVD